MRGQLHAYESWGATPRDFPSTETICSICEDCAKRFPEFYRQLPGSWRGPASSPNVYIEACSFRRHWEHAAPWLLPPKEEQAWLQLYAQSERADENWVEKRIQDVWLAEAIELAVIEDELGIIAAEAAAEDGPQCPW